MDAMQRAESVLTWVTHVMNASGQDHGSYLQVCQVVGKCVIGQKTAQSLSNIRCMDVVVVGVVCVVCLLYVLHAIAV